MSLLTEEIKDLQERQVRLRGNVRRKLPDDMSDELRELVTVSAALGWFNAIAFAENNALANVDTGKHGKGTRAPASEAVMTPKRPPGSGF